MADHFLRRGTCRGPLCECEHILAPSDNLSHVRQVLEQVGGGGCPKHKSGAESTSNALGVSLCFRLDEEAWSSAGIGITIGAVSVHDPLTSALLQTCFEPLPTGRSRRAALRVPDIRSVSQVHCRLKRVPGTLVGCPSVTPNTT